MTSQRSTVNPVLEPLVAVHREIYPKANLALLQRAYEVAAWVSSAPGKDGKPIHEWLQVRQVMEDGPAEP